MRAAISASAFASADAIVATGGGLSRGAAGRAILCASASAFIPGLIRSISSMHAATSASYARHRDAYLGCFFQSLCFPIVSTTRLQYAMRMRKSSCWFSSSR